METLQRQLQALYVTWQDQKTMRYFPVGRLVGGLRPDQAEYEFCYLCGAHEAQEAGFEPFLSFTELDRIYRSEELFPMFQNRIMSRSRAEYRDYLANLGLNADHDDPMAVLMRSGGGRATDSIEMFEVPRFSTEGNPYQTHFLSHGIRFLSRSSNERIADLSPNDRLMIMHDCQNQHDPAALALRTEDRTIVGYMPRYLLGDAITLLNNCEIVECFVARVNPPPAPTQQRLLVRIETCWPPDFVPFNENQYKPISVDASVLPFWP